MTQIYTQQVISSLHEKPTSYEERLVKPSWDPRNSGEYPSPYHPDRQYEGSGWKLSQSRSLHSNSSKIASEILAPKEGDMYQAKSEPTQNTAREQLPPLSSLFGSSASQSRPVQSPYSDRNSPVFPVTSPLDVRHPAPTIHPDRPYDGSYFQRPSTSRQYSYGSRPEQVERLGLQPPPRPSHPVTRPESPRYESHFTSSDSSRTQSSSTTNGWLPQSPHSRPGYFSRDTSSSFRPHPEQRPPPPPIHRPKQDPRSSLRDGHTPITPTYPPTPASTVAGEVSTGKDGLGPKIWTGTQFLPRFVRQAEVPGEGMCYFYDDGTHCKTVIDGEIVNAHWGVTKAGKPRKRLAIACITCREKKIKCDPDYPRCVQCEKFGRVCKFKNAPRGGQGSPDTPPADPDDIVPRPGSSRIDGESFQVEKREGSQSVSPRQRHGSPDLDTHISKRQRTSYHEFTPVASEASPRPSAREPTSPSTPWVDSNTSSAIDHNLPQEWQVNPFTAHPALATDLLSIFFKHIPDTTYCMFPEGPFKLWVLSPSEKSLDDLMLIYTILALGTVFSTSPEHKAFGVQYASISRYACDHRQFSIQLVQSRSLLALYYFALNNTNDSWDFCGAAMRAASGMKLNIEMEKSEDANLKVFPYGLNRAGYAECRRRTFWSCYLMDRSNGFCSGHLSVINPEDVFLRLPCDTKSFEAQADVQNPYFDASTPPIQNVNWTIGSMAYLINVSSIWGDVMASIYRTCQRPISLSPSSTFTEFHDKSLRRLHQWKESLPPCYQFSAESLRRAAETGKLGTYMTMHTVYHTTAILLHRYIQKSTLTAAQVSHHTSSAKLHAEDILSIMDTLSGCRSITSPVSVNKIVSAATKFSSPLVGYAIVSAVDVLTARFKLATIPSRLASFTGAQSILAEIAVFWQSAKNQQALVLQRVGELADLTTGKDAHGTIGALGFKLYDHAVGRENADGIYEMREALEKAFSRDYDLFYA